VYEIKPGRDRIEEALRTAWSFDATDRVIYGEPDQDETTNRPYAVISTQTSREFTGIRIVTETHTFTICGHFDKENRNPHVHHLRALRKSERPDHRGPEARQAKRAWDRAAARVLGRARLLHAPDHHGRRTGYGSSHQGIHGYALYSTAHRRRASAGHLVRADSPKNRPRSFRKVLR
jgi:hypothetical protein